MNIKSIISLGALTAILAGCGGNDGITLQPTNNTVNSNNSTGGGGGTGGDSNPCASYENASGDTVQGAFSSTTNNCTYSASFVSDTNPLTVDLEIAALDNNGVHIFEDSLWIGEDVNQAAADSGTAIPQEGEGPSLTVGPGAEIAFSSPEDYVRLARGSQIFAEGTATAPIVFSGVKDLVDDNATEGDRGLWGGIQINGNGFTNKCSMAGGAAFDPDNLTGDFAATANNPHDCHVTAEGRPATYGGVNNAESSGTLRYVQIRHAGYEVVDGDELNGLTLNAVGSGTTIEYVQTYTTQDDGFEMFGGAVNLKNIVAVNVGDDSIDYSEGYVGNIQFAVVMHTSGSNRCIEGDNTGGSRNDDTGPYTKLRISNMTCVTSNVDEGLGTQPTSKGSSEGPLFREGVYFEMYNSIVTSSDPAMASNECVEIHDDSDFDDGNTDGVTETFTSAAILAGYSVAEGNVVACSESLKDSSQNDGGPVFDIGAWFTTDSDNSVVDDGTYGTATLPASVITDLDTNPRAYITAPVLEDNVPTDIAPAIYDVTALEDDFDAQAAPAVGAAGDSTFFDSVNFIGAVNTGEDWVSSWTVGF